MRAAQRLRRSPPAVTRALAALEDRIGVRLVDRTTRRLAPTEAGRALYDRRARGRGRLRGRHGGRARRRRCVGLLRITAPVQFGRRHIAPIAARFLDAHQDVEIELLLNDRNVDLIEEGIDIALRIGALADSTSSARPVGHVPATMGGQSGLSRPTWHAAVAGRSRAARGSAGHVARRDGMELRRRPPRRAAASRGAAAGSTMSKPGCAPTRDGRGIAQFLSYQVADDLAAGRLVRLLRDFEPPPLPVQLAHQGSRPSCAKDRRVPRLRRQETFVTFRY